MITGASGQVTGSTVGATKEIGEASHGGNSGGASVWFQWRAPDTGEVIFNTSGSSFDTLLAVYEGATLVAENDDDNDDNTVQSAVRFSASQGHAYLIAVDGYGGRTGSYVLNWRLGGPTPPPGGSVTPTPTDPTPLADALADLAEAQGALETLDGLTRGLVAMLEAALDEASAARAAQAAAEAALEEVLAGWQAADEARAQAEAERDEALAGWVAAEAALAQAIADGSHAVAERHAALARWEAAEAALAACQAGQL